MQHSGVHRGVLCKCIFFIKKLTSLMLKATSLRIVGTSDYAYINRRDIISLAVFIILPALAGESTRLYKYPAVPQSNRWNTGMWLNAVCKPN